jgi:hypothetical protein
MPCLSGSARVREDMRWRSDVVRGTSDRHLMLLGQPRGARSRARRALRKTGLRVCRLVRIGYSSERTPVAADVGRHGQGGHADVAQLVAHHLAKVRVAGSNPVVRSRCRKPSLVSRRTARLFGISPALPAELACGGMAEWLRQGPAKPCTRVRFPLPPRGRLAQRESASLTRKRSLVQSQYRPPDLPARTPGLASRFAVSGGLRAAKLAQI